MFGNHRYVYTMGRYLSSRNLQVESIAPHLLEYFGRFSPPKEILSEQGTEFSNNVMKAMLQAIEVILR